MDSLYICYQSLSEPLTQTQVVAYLEGLAQAGYKIVLLTFEPRRLTVEETSRWRGRMLQRGISWYWLRYHKYPTAPATAWDILSGIALGYRLIRKYKVRLLHARSHVPGIIASTLKHLTGAKLLFDLRGFMAEEYVDAGIWRENGVLFRMLKRAERILIGSSDSIVVLTERAKSLLREWYPKQIAGKPIQVIPCCADLRGFPQERLHKMREGHNDGPVTLVYTGKLGGWYPTNEMVEFAAAAQQCIPQLHWQVWTQSDASSLREYASAGGLENVSIGRVEPSELLNKLLNADAGLSLYKRRLSAAACSPTKVGEYLAAGLPVISTAGIGDVDELLANGDEGPVGIVIKELSPSGYAGATAKLKTLLQEPDIRERCHGVAKKNLDLETVGWVRYRKIYQDLLGA